jgi:hypothetical protein
VTRGTRDRNKYFGLSNPFDRDRKDRTRRFVRIIDFHALIDISDLIKAGDEVIIFGTKPLATELAKAAGTISYEIVSGIGSRTPRIPVAPENQVSEV